MEYKVDNVNISGEPRSAYHHGDLRNALVAAAIRLIEREGPAAFSLREAARDVGVSANAAYRHFADKSALMTAAAADGFAQLTQRMLQAIDAVTPQPSAALAALARFKAVGRAYIEFAVARPALFHLMFGEFGVACLQPGFHDGATPNAWALLGQALDALVTAGLLAPERRPDAELSAWAAVHGFAALALAGVTAPMNGPAHHAAREALLEMTVNGLCGSAGPTA
jgi:AcrR family transcriptional regulator